MEPSRWIADRTRAFDSSGIRKVFDLAAGMEDPVNLSIGQPDFDVPQPVRQACIEAIESRKNGYALTQGMPVLRDKLQAQVEQQYGHADRCVFVTSGTSGGLVLAMLSLVNPGDEVIIFDPFFVMYEPLVQLVGGKAVFVDTYPDFRIDVRRVAAALTPRTKLILFNSPANPTGAVAGPDEVRGLAELSAERQVALISDEIYREFCYDQPFVSPAQFNDTDDRDRRVLQEPRHDRLARWVRARSRGDHRDDGQAAAVHVCLRTAAGTVGRSGRAGRGRERLDAGLPRETGSHRAGPGRLLRTGHAGRRVLCFSPCAARHRDRVRRAER